MVEQHVFGYSGFTVPIDGWEVPRIPERISATEFWKRHVCQRKPAVIEGLPRECLAQGSGGTEVWRDEKGKLALKRLKSIAGNRRVDVERRVCVSGGAGGAARSSASGSGAQAFGHGRKQRMRLEEFLDSMSKGRDELYLSAQELPVLRGAGSSAAARRSLLAEPVLSVWRSAPQGSRFALRPRLAGHLVPQQVNVWMGVSKTGTSSGLHHDYHDNLYLLLKGRKQFTLFSPADADNLYTEGTIAHVHPNGRINYDGLPRTRGDGVEVDDSSPSGSREADAGRPKRRRVRSRSSGSDSSEVAGGLHSVGPTASSASSAKSKRIDAEIAISAASAAVAAARESGDAAAEAAAQTRLDSAEEELDAALEAALDDEDVFDEFDDEDDEESSVASVESERADLRTPPSFSRIPVQELRRDNPSELFPKLRHARSVVVEIRAGQMLYLPAGWFHEVLSIGDDDAEDAKADEPDHSHVALNYWFHPPEQLGVDSYETPYVDSYWEGEYVEQFNALTGEARAGKKRSRRQSTGSEASA